MFRTPLFDDLESFVFLISAKNKDIKIDRVHDFIDIRVYNDLINIFDCLDDIHSRLCTIDSRTSRFVFFNTFGVLNGNDQPVTQSFCFSKQFNMPQM